MKRSVRDKPIPYGLLVVVRNRLIRERKRGRCLTAWISKPLRDGLGERKLVFWLKTVTFSALTLFGDWIPG